MVSGGREVRQHGSEFFWMASLRMFRCHGRMNDEYVVVSRREGPLGIFVNEPRARGSSARLGSRTDETTGAVAAMEESNLPKNSCYTERSPTLTTFERVVGIDRH